VLVCRQRGHRERLVQMRGNGQDDELDGGIVQNLFEGIRRLEAESARGLLCPRRIGIECGDDTARALEPRQRVRVQMPAGAAQAAERRNTLRCCALRAAHSTIILAVLATVWRRHPAAKK